MDEKLKRVIELANQLQAAVDELDRDCVLCVSIYHEGGNIPSGIHIYRPELYNLDGLKFENQDKYGDRWFCTEAYGIRVYGAVKGGDAQ